MQFKRKYIDLSVELCDKLALVCAEKHTPQRRYIEEAISEKIARDSASGKQKAKKGAKK